MHATWQEAYTDVKAHAKSNTHQLVEIKTSLKEIQERQQVQNDALIKIQSVVVDDGLVTAVKANSEDLKEFREKEFKPFEEDFQNFIAHRYDTCPVARQLKENRTWKVTVIRIIFGAIGVISTLIIIGEKIMEVL